MSSRWLTLSDGTRLEGCALGANISRTGEIVVHTGNTGYMECITDPSYRGQILCFSYPMIGNYGVNSLMDNLQSSQAEIAGLVIGDVSEYYGEQKGFQSLHSYLLNERIPAISGVDTRLLTKLIQRNCVLTAELSSTHPIATPETELGKNHLVKTPVVNIAQKEAKSRVLLVDCGCKTSILSILEKENIHVCVVDYKLDYHDHRSFVDSYDAIVVSNGPGDPLDYPEIIQSLERSLKLKTPIFGICLGHQVLALAAGAKTYRLKHPHRSHNQPILDVTTMRCYNSSQNHSFSVETESLPSDWSVWFENLNDLSLEGMRHNSCLSRSVQFHPEGASGPTELKQILIDFIQEVIEL